MRRARPSSALAVETTRGRATKARPDIVRAVFGLTPTLDARELVLVGDLAALTPERLALVVAEVRRRWRSG